MRLFPLVDGTIEAADRTSILSGIFDLILHEPLTPQAAVGGPDYGITAANCLYVYDSGSADSIEVKDYFLSHRTGLEDIDTLGINLTGLLTAGDVAFETISPANFDSSIKAALLTYLNANPNVHYLQMGYGMPIRFTDQDATYSQGIPTIISRLGGTGSTYYDSASDASDDQYDHTKRYLPSTWASYPGTRCLPTWLAMRSKADAKAYIDKISGAHPGGSQVVVYANNRYGGKFIFDHNRVDMYEVILQTEHAEDWLEQLFPDVEIESAADEAGMLLNPSDVLCYIGWPHHSGIVSGSYMTDPDITFGGLTAFYCMFDYYSFGGTYKANGSEGRPYDFTATSYGGTNYSRTPRVGVGNLEENGTAGFNPRSLALQCAYGAFNCELYQSRDGLFPMVIGDLFASGGVFQDATKFMVRGQVYVPGAARCQLFAPGATSGRVFVPGSSRGQVIA